MRRERRWQESNRQRTVCQDGEQQRRGTTGVRRQMAQASSPSLLSILSLPSRPAVARHPHARTMTGPSLVPLFLSFSSVRHPPDDLLNDHDHRRCFRRSDPAAGIGISCHVPGIDQGLLPEPGAGHQVQDHSCCSGTEWQHPPLR